MLYLVYMGVYFTDKFSLLHFATGIIVYYWNVSFLFWFIIHLLFEYIENTETGMYFINKIKLWPGGKEKSDFMINRLGDQFYASIGWIIAYFVCSNT
tara:strand:+ start:995 stop:1285 length:291 start_codon:yes stop_codon:yes gene_type:complete